MARIAGVNVPTEKRVVISLTYIYGIGPTRSQKILTQANIDQNIRVKDLTESEINRIREILEKNYKIEGDLKREVTQNISRLKEVASYRGIRHKLNLPVKGQRTKTNSRTKRGKRITMGSGKKKVSKT
ncbi:MAG: 30S ribosomal protein S13 [bacterium]